VVHTPHPTLDHVFLHTPPHSPRPKATYQHANNDSLFLDPPLSIGNETIKQHSLEPKDLNQWFLPSSRAHITPEQEGGRPLMSISPLHLFAAHPEQAAWSTLVKRKKQDYEAVSVDPLLDSAFRLCEQLQSRRLFKKPRIDEVKNDEAFYGTAV
jgi:hypothetical protein